VRYQKILLLLFAMAIVLATAACNNFERRVDISPAAAAYTATVTKLDTVAESNPVAEADGMLHAGIISGHASRLEFTLRNTTGKSLFYDDGFTLYRLSNGHWEYESSMRGETTHELAHAVTRSYHIDWWFSGWRLMEEGHPSAPEYWTAEVAKGYDLPAGRYVFIRRLFTDPHHMELHDYLYIEFDVAYFDVAYEEKHDDLIWQQERLEFILCGLGDRRIRQSRDAVVDRNGIVFGLVNNSEHHFRSSLLAKYSDGNWLYVSLPDGRSAHISWFEDNPGHLGHVYTVGFWPCLRRSSFHGFSPGRYMLVMEFGDSSSNRIYVPVEFNLEEKHVQQYIALAEYGGVTPTGMEIVISNTSGFYFEHHGYLWGIERYEEGRWHQLSDRFIHISDFWGDEVSAEQRLFPSGWQLQLNLDWAEQVGALEPGKYRITLDASLFIPQVHPSHVNEVLDIEFVIGGTAN